MSASNTALPPPTCIARREAGQCHLLAVVLRRGRPTAGCFASRPVPGRPSAGCVCLQRPGSAGCVCLLCHLCHAIPTALLIVCPRSVLLCPHLFISMCGRIIAQAARTVPLAAGQVPHTCVLGARDCMRAAWLPANCFSLCRVH